MTYYKIYSQSYDKAQKIGLSLWYFNTDPDHLYLAKIDDALYSQNCPIIAQGNLSDLLPIIDHYYELKAFL